jgi:hypothetical protein
MYFEQARIKFRSLLVTGGAGGPPGLTGVSVRTKRARTIAAVLQ